MGYGKFGYALGAIANLEGEGAGDELQFVSVALPVIALVGTGTVLAKPIVGGSITAVSVIGILIYFGFGFFNLVTVVLLGVASFLAFADWKRSSPSQQAKILSACLRRIPTMPMAILVSAAIAVFSLSASLLSVSWAGTAVEALQSVQDVAPRESFRVAQTDSIPVVPPEPEPTADSAPSNVASSTDDPVTEILSLRDTIGTRRDELETGRKTALEQAMKDYRAALASIAPKDMFETDEEHVARVVREKSEAALATVRSEREINSRYDALLNEEVEPMFKRVHALLSASDIVPENAIKAQLEKYDPERGVFIGTLEIESSLLKRMARVIVPMQRARARTFWKNRASLIGRVSLSLDVHSLDIDIGEFWIEDPQSATRTKKRIAVLEIRRPSPNRPDEAGTHAPSEEQLKRAGGLKVSVAALAKQSAKGGRYESTVKGWIGDYNRLVSEAKSVFTKDPHIQALKTLAYGGYSNQAAGAVTIAAKGLETYLTSFVSSDAFKVSAAALAKLSQQSTEWRDFIYSGARESIAKGWIGDYNRLVSEAKSVFAKDPHIQALKTLAFGGDRNQAAGAVTIAAKGLETYLTSFVPSDAFKVSVAALAKRSAKGGRYESTVKGWIGDYNRLVSEAKSVFAKDPHIQALKTLAYSGYRTQAAGAVTIAAKGLETYLTSFLSSDAFKVSAAALAKLSQQSTEWRHFIYSGAGESIAKGWIGDYNRLVSEAKSVFAKDPHIQALKTLAYGGDKNQATGAVTIAAKKLASILLNAKTESPESVNLSASPSYTPLDYLPYSGRFSPNARKLAKLLRRKFSPDARDKNGWSDLHYAAALNLPGLASALLDADADPNLRIKNDGDGYTGDLRGTLAAFGYNVGDWVRQGQTPLHFAAWLGADLTAMHLIANGADVDAQSDAKRTPLDLAAWRDSRTVAELLIGQGADVDVDSSDGYTPLDYALYGKAAGTAELIRRHGGTCNRICQ